MERNGLEQMMALRRHLLPGETDSESNLARALWLFKRQRTDLENIISNAVGKAFSG